MDIMGIKDAVGQAQGVVDDVQADLDKRQAWLVALLADKRLKITVEFEDKPPASGDKT